MITIICGTNRTNSATKKVAGIYEKILQSRQQQTFLIDLVDLPNDFIVSALYENAGKNLAFNPIQDHISKSEKFVFVTPEYNGSFPGILKTFIDALKFPDTFEGKKCAMVGISSGVQGAVLAMSHLTDIFNYLGMNVLAKKPKLSFIDGKMNDDLLVDVNYMQLLREQADAFINF